MKSIRIFSFIALCLLASFIVYDIYQYLYSYNYKIIYPILVLTFCIHLIYKKLHNYSQIYEKMIIISYIKNYIKNSISESRLRSYIFLYDLKLYKNNQERIFSKSKWQISYSNLTNSSFDKAKSLYIYSYLPAKNINFNNQPINIEIIDNIIQNFQSLNDEKLQKYIYNIMNELKFNKYGLISFKETMIENKDKFEKALNEYQ